MSKEHVPRLDLEAIDASLTTVRDNWESIQAQLDATPIGRKDTPFTDVIQANILSAYALADDLLRKRVPPMSAEFVSQMPVFNNRIHYGESDAMRREYRGAITAAYDKFAGQIESITSWYRRHVDRRDPVSKLASEIYVAILGQPQLFIEGNHRTAAVIASYISAFHNRGIFVLTAENALAYFMPSAEIKKFNVRSVWRHIRLPKYHADFADFWKQHIDKRYLK